MNARSALASALLFGMLLNSATGLSASPAATSCAKLGWFPTSYGLKDHSVFTVGNVYYLVSNRVPAENLFVYARTLDMCAWETLSPVLPIRIPNTWDSYTVWSPFVYAENGTYYLFYTGVTATTTQSIMLSQSSNPADSSSWQTGTLMLQPAHASMLWQNGQWADCRDPMVIKVGDNYFLYYTGLDQMGGIVGVATSSSITGPWYDWGAILTLRTLGAMPESPSVTTYDGIYYLFYNKSSALGANEQYVTGPGPTGPWSSPVPLTPGWGNEFWRGLDNLPYTSYLTGYSVTISRLTWDTLFWPAHPFIGASVLHTWLPSISR